MPMGAATVDGLGELPPQSPMQMLRDEVNLGPVGITDKEPRCEASFEGIVKLTKIGVIDPQDIVVDLLRGPTCWVSESA